jgi:hypothetical protein
MLERLKNKIHGKHRAHFFAKHILPVVLPKKNDKMSLKELCGVW